MQGLPRSGVMAAVFADEATVAAEIRAMRPGRRCDRCIERASQHGGLGRAGRSRCSRCADFEALGIRCRLLSVSHAFHSPLMRPAADAFVAVAASAQGPAAGHPVDLDRLREADAGPA